MEIWILKTLIKGDTSLTTTEIHEHINACGQRCERRTVQRTLDELENRGLVINKTLSRTKRYELTKLGTTRGNALVKSLVELPLK